MFRRSLLFSLAALMLATPAMAQRFGYQDAPQGRSDRDHRRGESEPPRNNRDEGRGNSGRRDGRFNDNRNDGRNASHTEGRNGQDWRQQQPDPRADARADPRQESHAPPPDQRSDQRSERAPPLEHRRYDQQDPGQRPYERPPERPREVQLTDILRNLRGQYGGQHLDAQRSGENYVIPWLSRDGRRMTVVVDAATGRVISVR